MCRPSSLRWAVAAALLTGWAAGQPAAAADPAWPSSPYRYLVVDQDLRVLLEEFGRNTGLRVALTEGVKGRVRGSLPQVHAREFLDTAARTYGLDWYYDGSVMHVSTTAEAATRLLDLRGVPFHRLVEGLDQAGIADARFGMRQGPALGSVMVSGPPRYIQLVSDAVATMAGQKPQAAVFPVAAQVRVFRGSAAIR